MQRAVAVAFCHANTISQKEWVKLVGKKPKKSTVDLILQHRKAPK
jgi:hypothetical protein